MCEQNYLDNVQLITYTLVKVCTKLPRQCAVNNLHTRKCVNKTT